MKKSVMLLLAVLIAGAVYVVPSGAEVMSTKMYSNKNAVVLRMDMRELWEEHITLTRNYIISALADLEDAGKVAERLLKNQDDIGSAIIPYYGDAAGKKLASLLREHILIAVDVVKAAKAGNQADLDTQQAKWKSNANDIAAFLSGANPHWPVKDMQEMLYKHLDLTTTEVVSRLNKDWAADIMAWDMGQDHMLMFADTLTNGIVMQFPKKF